MALSVCIAACPPVPMHVSTGCAFLHVTLCLLGLGGGGEGGLGLGGGGGVGGGGSAAGHCNNTSSYIQVHCTKLLQHSLFLLAFVLLNFVFFLSLALSMVFLIPLCSVESSLLAVETKHPS